MDKEKIKEIVKDVSIRSNTELYESRDLLIEEFNKTKELVVDLTHHIDAIQEMYDKINDEIGKRTKV